MTNYLMTVSISKGLMSQLAKQTVIEQVSPCHVMLP